MGASLLGSLREELQAGDLGARAFEHVAVNASTISNRDPVLLDGQIRRLLGSAALSDDLTLGELLSERARAVDSAALRALLYLEAACRFDRGGHPNDSATALLPLGALLVPWLKSAA